MEPYNVLIIGSGPAGLFAAIRLERLGIDRMTLWDAAAAPESLKIMLFGAAITLPAILAYSAYSYRVFWGKTSELNY